MACPEPFGREIPLLKIIFHYIKSFRADCAATILMVVIETVCSMLLTVTIGRFIDALANQQAGMSQIYGYGLRLLAIAAVLLAAGLVSGWTSMRAAAGLARNLRNGLFERIQAYSFTNIEHFSPESLVTRMTTDVMNVQNSAMMLLRVVTMSPLTLLCGLVMAFTINWRLGLVYAVAIPILALGLYGIASRALPLFPQVFRLYDRLNRMVRENLLGIRVVKSFVREDHESEKFLEVSEELRQKFTRAECIFALNSPLMQFTIYLCVALITWLASRAIVLSQNGTLAGVAGMTTGQLQNLFTYGFMILSSLMMFSTVYVMLMMSQASSQRIEEVLEEPIRLTSPANGRTDVPDGSIDFDHVDFSYHDEATNLCLKDIDLHIRSGETIGIIGSTGSGKSSLVQLIPRLYDVTAGSVKVGGHDVREYDLEALRNQVAMVLQKNVFFSGTIKENLRWGKADATDEEILQACRAAQADEFVQRFPDKYDTYIEQGGTNVSGGQRQRLCIARALLKRPKILILDDSTSAVDTRTDAQINQALRTLLPKTTKLIIAQRISSVEHADRILVIDQGQIQAVGTHAELLRSNDIYQEIYQSQQKGEDAS